MTGIDDYAILRKIALDSRLRGSMIRICLLCFRKDQQQSELIKITGRDKSNISRECRKLVEMGYLERTEKNEGAGAIWYRLKE